MNKQHEEKRENGNGTGRTLCGREMPPGNPFASDLETCQRCADAAYRLRTKASK